MARVTVPLLAFNRGLVSPEALARVDLDRTRMSAEVMTNWLPKTQGAMRIRPGTKYLGSSLNDTGAEFIEFIASTDDTALLELTDSKMRVWDGDALLSRPAVSTTLTLTDTGWVDASTGGAASISPGQLIPKMDQYSIGNVIISASGDHDYNAGDPINFPRPGWGLAWTAFDDDTNSSWVDTGPGGNLANGRPSWLNVDFGAGNTKTVTQYTLRAAINSADLDNMASSFSLLGSNHDTGSYATDTGKWTLEDNRTSETGWAVSEKRTYDLSDTGTADAWRHWRLYVRAIPGVTGVTVISEVEMFSAVAATQVDLSSGFATLNATAKGSLAKITKEVVVDTGVQSVEHSLDINVSAGPVALRCGSTAGDDDYISETDLQTGYHNLAFTPTGNFHVTLQSGAIANRTINSLAIGDSGTVEVSAPWGNSDLDNIRSDQSADVVFVDAQGIKPYQIERRGTGRSWSVVEHVSDFGPFVNRSSSAKLSVSRTFGNTTLSSDTPFFRPGHEGALFKLTHDGQGFVNDLGAGGATSDVIKMTGINDTGVAFQDTATEATQERQIRFEVTGSYQGRVMIQKSLESESTGFHNTEFADTGTAQIWVQDNDDNVTVWYRALLEEGSYVDGAAHVEAFYYNGSKTGIGRVTSYESNTSVGIETIRTFSDTGVTDLWQEGAWSDVRGYPGAVALHEGRLAHAGESNIWLSVSDDFNNHDIEFEGDAGPISKTLGSGPVDRVFYLASLIRMIAGTSGSEIAIRASSIDEPLTPTNNTAKAFSTQGSANIRALTVDSRAFYVQRSTQRLFSIGFGQGIEAVGDYESNELTLLVPELLQAGVVSIAVQRQPDTRIHCVLADGRVAILTYEPQEEVLAWSMWQTDTGTNGAVERVAVLPGSNEDQVYYHVQRTFNGTKHRFLERWASERESRGDTGLSWIADCAASWTGATADTGIDGFSHLAGQSVVAWANDTGQTNAGKDLTPDDTGGTQQLLVVDTGGGVPVAGGALKLVAGLPYEADWKSTKLAYAAQAGTALTQMKRVSKLGLVLSQTHNDALRVGVDTGAGLDRMPRFNNSDTGQVDPDKIYKTFDEMSFPINGDFDSDERLVIKAKAPRPATVMAAVPDVQTNEKI